MPTSRRHLSPFSERVADPATDRQLRNHDERIRELVKRMEAVELLAGGLLSYFPQTVSLASDQIQCGTTLLVVTEIGVTASVTLTSTPTISPGLTDGQLLVLRRSAVNTLTIQNETVLARSALRLDGGTNKALSSRDVIILTWRASVEEWYQVSPVSSN